MDGAERPWTMLTTLVLGNILREIAIETFETLRVWWAG